MAYYSQRHPFSNQGLPRIEPASHAPYRTRDHSTSHPTTGIQHRIPGPPNLTNAQRTRTNIRYIHIDTTQPSPRRRHDRSQRQEMTGIEYKSPPRPPNQPSFEEGIVPNDQSSRPIYPTDEMPVYPSNMNLHDVNIWDIYNQKAALADADLSTGFNSSMDVLLIFAGLFSAVLTAFIIETYKLLQPDPTDLTNQLLYAILQNQSTALVSPDFSPPTYAVRVNALFFASLLTSLLAALAAMLVKQWVSYYDQGLRKITSRQIKARTRQYRYDGIVRWHMPEVAAAVPMVLHLSLFLFFGGIVEFLFVINKPIAFISLILLLMGALLYLFVNALPLASSNAPFRSPLTQLLDTTAQKIRRKYMRRRLPVEPTDEAIEDPTDLWFGEEDPQARMVLLTRSLDVDALVWLILETDKMTERGLLDMCFEKLMTFQSIADKNPSSLLRKEISRTYLQIASTCVDIPTRTILPKRGPRAHLLCRFLDWYLTIPTNEGQTQWMIRNMPFHKSILPQAYASYANEMDDIQALIIAQIAHRRLFHLHSPRDVECRLCLEDMVLYSRFADLSPPERSRWMSLNGDSVVRDLISISHCVFSRLHDVSRLDHILDQAASFIEADEDPTRTFGPLKLTIDSETPIYPRIAARWRNGLNAAIGDEPNERREPRT